MAQLPLVDKISRAKNILEKIVVDDNDSTILEHYNLLKLCYGDEELRPHLVQIAKTATRANRRFGNTILDEISTL